MFTLNECVARINQVLNYPSLAYTDISHFFDQAISELNTSLKIGLPPVSQIVDEKRSSIYDLPNLVVLHNLPTGINAKIMSVTDVAECTDTSIVYYDTSKSVFYKYDLRNSLWTAYDTVYGVHLLEKSRETYKAMPLFSGEAIWSPYSFDNPASVDMNIYLPTDWIILFLIPYVCFKAAVRDGSNGSLYNEEFVQGFQQLQTSYDIPNFVDLVKVAHLPAYKALTKENITALNKKVPTRAIYESMKIGNATLPEYGGFNSRGGWGF